MVNATDIIGGTVHTSSDIATRFRDSVARSTGATCGPSAGGRSGHQPLLPLRPPAPSGGAQTFPMADPKPGQEPQPH
ncbi:MAG: hypothetical protein WDM77_19535 [Steroidobacteraceae bacterium]